MNRSQIEHIYPLNFIQQALLFHHLQEKEDQGIIQVECKLTGELDITNFENAWNFVIERHKSLRTSIHWENISKPSQVVHKKASIELKVNDISNGSPSEENESIARFKQDDFAAGMDLTQAPNIEVGLVKTGKTTHWLIWKCHHILLDGWSSVIVLNEVLQIYENIQSEKNPFHKLPIPVASSEYLQQQPKDSSNAKEIFWTETLKGFDEPILLVPEGNLKSLEGQFSRTSRALPKELAGGLNKAVSIHKISLNTLLQSIWGMLLCKLMDSKDMLIGVTVSGRSGSSGINAESVVGMLMNVLPVRVNLSDEASITQWLRNIQNQTIGLMKFEEMSMGEIAYYKNWSSNISLFNSLFVFENYPTKQLASGLLTMDHYRSGITTTYPLTLLVSPGDSLEFLLCYKSDYFSSETINSLLDGMEKAIKLIIEFPENSIEKFYQEIDFPDKVSERQKSGHAGQPSEQSFGVVNTNSNMISQRQIRKAKGSNTNLKSFIPPEDTVQLTLCQLWEDLFGQFPIGLEDNFFDLGGTSLMAVQLFAQIEKSFGYHLPPTELFNSPTVRQLSDLLKNTNKKLQGWTSLVPLRKTGSKRPLFCLHAGGAHVFFYHDLARHLGPDQPVYALQPLGLDGINEGHNSVEEMAGYYIHKIKEVQPSGPYSILGTCFSDSVAIEMAHQLKDKGEKLEPLFIVDSVLIPIKDEQRPNQKKKNKSFSENLKSGDFKEMFLKGYKKIQKKIINKPDSQQITNLKRIRERLRSLYSNYEIKPINSPIVLVHTNLTEDRKGRLVDAWNKVTLDKLHPVAVENTSHFSIFEEPSVIQLAHVIQTELLKAETNHVKEIAVNQPSQQ